LVSSGRLPVHELGVAIVVLGEAANTHPLEAWNDDSNRTQASVLRAFDTALALAWSRAREQFTVVEKPFSPSYPGPSLSGEGRARSRRRPR
jgi:hypothetical protein